MQLIIPSLLALASVLPAHAFTNGSLIPAYFCNPKPDGLPKSLGQLIPQTHKDQNNALAFNANPKDNLNVVPLTNSTPGNTGYMLASFHNSVNTIKPITPGLGVKLAIGTSLKAGEANLLILDSLATGIALDGALIHARNAAGTPVGFFTDAGKIFVNFPGCGKTKEGQFNGVVHSQLISCNQTYTQLSYHAPKCGTGPITLGGLSVTDNGFGVWNQTFTVTGGPGFVADVMPSFDYMEEHLQLQLESFALQNQPSIEEDGAPMEYSMGYINTLNAQLKLQKYKAKNTSVVLFAACVLVPWRKWDYFEEHLTAQEMRDAKRLVQDLWDTKYAIITLPESMVIKEVREGTASEAPNGSAPKADVLKDFIRRRKKGPRTAVQDEYTRYCLLDVTEELQGGDLQWWMIHEAEFPRLAQFARDIFSIPGMSAEVERLFSSAKLMIPPHRSSLKPESIEAGECIRSWVAGGLFFGDYFDYLSPDERNREAARLQAKAPFGERYF